MGLVFAKNEKIVKRFDYSSSEVNKGLFFGKKQTNHALIITNKRIIKESMSDDSVTREEIPVTAATAIDTHYRAIGRLLALLIVGICCLLASGVLLAIGFIEDMLSLVIPGAIWAVISIALIIGFFLRKPSCTVYIDIFSENPQHSVMDLGAVTYNSRKKPGRAGRVKSVRIMVNEGIAVSMVDSLGAILLDIQNTSAAKPDEDDEDDGLIFD